jgi:hypothetical protein
MTEAWGLTEPAARASARVRADDFLDLVSMLMLMLMSISG